MFKINNISSVAIILIFISFYAASSFADNHDSANSAITWDMDSNGEADALTDGLLLLRYSFGMRGESLTNGAVSSNSVLTTSDIVSRVEASLSIADIDGNSEVDALTDSLLLLRYLFGLAGDTLINGAVANNATRISADQITQYIYANMPGEMPVDSDNDGVNDADDAFPNNPNEAQDSDNDGVGDNSDIFPNDASETTDTDNDGVGDNADAFPNDPSETTDLNNNGIGDNADANASTGPQSDFCSSPLFHLGMEAEVPSKVNLTIENIGNNTVSLSMVSADTSAVDALTVEGGSGASITEDSSASNGTYAKLLTWSGGMPDNTTVTILWSKVTTGGMWIVRDIPVVTAATCSGSNSGGGSGDNGSGDSGSNPSDPNDPAPTPTDSDADVLSIFSDNYSDISGVDFNPNWGQATSVSVANGEISYQNLNYQGTTFGGPRDVSGYGYFHIDVLPEQSGSLQLYLINSSAVTGNGPIETYFDLNLTASEWNNFEIPLSAFTPIVDLSKVDEIKIVGTGNLKLDNLYFGGSGDYGDGNGGEDIYDGADVIPTEEISVANGILVGGVNSTKPQYAVYVFDSDPISAGVSNCYGGCASAWPPVYVTDDIASGVSNLDSITRSDGTLQVTYEGRPLYFYAGDQQPGERSGDSVSGWHSIEYGNIGQVNKLYNDSTPLEPVTSFTRDDGVIVTRLADRGRDRHAKDSGFQDHYDHYLAHYWQFRTMRIQLEDYVPLGQSKIAVTWITESALGAKEFRVWYAGQNTTGQFWFNPQPLGQQANPNEPAVVYHGSGTWNNDFVKTSSQGGQHKYTLNITTRWQLGGQIQEPLQLGMNMEFEASMFLQNPPAGTRLNYYGTSFVYVVGEQGVHPFQWQTGQQDGTPIPQKGLSGGATTLGYNYTNEPAGRFMQMATNMSPGNAEPFVRGRRVHHTSFVNGVHGERHDNPVWTQQAGKSSTHYINESCAGCHVRNGRALVADIGGSLDKWVFKVGDENGDPLSTIGSVLQPTKIGGGASEGSVTLGPWTELENGLRSPNYQFTNGTPPQFSARIAPSLVGMGLLEAIDESTIISWADENDADNDGISGRASIVEDPTSGVMRLGRFGYKAGTFSVKHQVASAFNTDMGVMTSMIPEPDCGSQQTNCGNSGAEISDVHVDELVKYVSLLGVGARRNYNNQGGEALFQTIGCADCHRPSMVTSNFHPLAELRGQTIYPYSDMLLHDMGPGLADNLAEGTASGSEWRTAPLWGLGLTKNVMLGDSKGNDLVSLARDYPNDLNRIGYLHDGRARTIDEAIRWHGGEANNSKNAYEALTAGERDAVIDFLESL
ncbi:MAG: di-heme oxidoredictase family protein [Porticoccaceae bacterium]